MNVAFFDDSEDDLVRAESVENAKEVFDFGPDVGYAIEVEDADQEGAVELPEFELHTAPDMDVSPTSTSEITMNDVALHNDLPWTSDGPRGEGTVSVITDSGIDPTHPLFDDTEITQYDCISGKPGSDGPVEPTDQFGHGTAVSGVVSTFSPDTEIIMLQIFDSNGRTNARVILRAYEWLLANPDRYDTVGMSWGSTRPSDQIDRLHEALLDTGAIDSVSAGNSGSEGGSPATSERSFSVGATTIEGTVAEFSSYDPTGPMNPEISAVGVDMLLARARGTDMLRPSEKGESFGIGDGTSFSQPVNHAAMNLLLSDSNHPDWDREMIRTSLKETAREILGSPREGHGELQYNHASRYHDASFLDRCAEEFSNLESVNIVYRDKYIELFRRFADLHVVYDDGSSYMVECEKDWQSAIDSIGSVELYASSDSRCSPLVLLPDGEIDIDERDHLEDQYPIELRSYSEFFTDG